MFPARLQFRQRGFNSEDAANTDGAASRSISSRLLFESVRRARSAVYNSCRPLTMMLPMTRLLLPLPTPRRVLLLLLLLAVGRGG